MVFYHDRRDAGARQPFGRGAGTRDEDVVEGEVVDSRPGETKGKTPEERVGEFLRSVAAGITKDKKTSLKEAVEKSRRIRRAEQTLGTPGKGAGITVRREGMLRTPKPQDSARFEADKASHDHGYLLYQVMLYLAKVIYSGKKIGMELHDSLTQMDEEYSEAAEPFGELMTEWGMEKFMDTFKEAVDMYPAMRLEDIAEAMLVRPYIWRS
jgi:hypothetical protein